MSLEQLEQQAEELQLLDVTKLSPEQLSSLVEKLSTLFEKSEILASEIKIDEDETDSI